MKYTACRPNQYEIPGNRTFIHRENFNKYILFDFTVHKDVKSDGEPSAKRMKVQLLGKLSKNQLLCTTRKKHYIHIWTGNRFRNSWGYAYTTFVQSSKADLYIYHKQYFKQGTVNVACMANKNNDEDKESDHDDCESLSTTVCCSGIWEMKNEKAVKQLIANMFHFGYQLTVNALKEGNNWRNRGAISYSKKVGGIYKLTVDFSKPQTFIEDFSIYSVKDAVNIIIEKVTQK